MPLPLRGTPSATPSSTAVSIPTSRGLIWLAILILFAFVSAAPQSRGAERADSVLAPLVSRYCVSCHDAEVKKGDLNLDTILNDKVAEHPDVWERAVRKLRARQMPPIGKKRPDESAYYTAITSLTSELDRAAALHPNPGRTETFHRLNRTEYQNAIRDLLALEIDATSLLPKDDVGQGFDNVGAGNLSPTLLNRYISAAEKISQLAIGAPRRTPGGDTFRMRPDVTQE